MRQDVKRSSSNEYLPTWATAIKTHSPLYAIIERGAVVAMLSVNILTLTKFQLFLNSFSSSATMCIWDVTFELDSTMI